MEKSEQLRYGQMDWPKRYFVYFSYGKI